ncbi:PREDICTED: odorant receptor 4-like [Eufriesea mexicana]|uniref:odorant receptor 4-like n=1 Tax=Eufriesea mexicana TaxID=516756 RepID=UPI00083BD4FD|nr:PREDICTED: odorant receptor 4-like [Eufriesea mexicana]
MQVQRWDISMKVTVFFLRNIGIWITNDPTEKRRMKILLTYTVWNSVWGFITAVRDLYFTSMYNGDVLYSLTTALTVLMGLIKICVILKHRGDFISLIVDMQQKFWNVKYDFQEKIILENCNKICTLFVCSVTTIGMCAMLSYVLPPIFLNRERNESERVLPFTVWLNLPLSMSPYYEIMFIVEAGSLYCVGTSYFCFDNIFCIMAIHLAGQFRILRYRLATMCDLGCQIIEKDAESVLAKQVHEFYEKFKLYVRQHQALIDFCDKLENVYTMIILGQVLVFSILICLFGYQVLVAEAPTTRRAIFVFLLIGSMSLLFTFTYSCNGIIEHSDNIAIGAYSALWTVMPMNTTGKKLRDDLIMVIVRARRVCCLTANGFFPVSLETYTTILSTAVSYFSLLMNNIENKDET